MKQLIAKSCFVILSSYIITYCLFVLAGCSTKVTGGQSHHYEGESQTVGGESLHRDIDLRVLPDGTVTVKSMLGATTQPSYREEHDNVASTQPSGETNTGANLSLGEAKEGMLGSLSFTQIERKYRNSWVLAAVFALLAIASLYLLKDPLLAIVFAACGVVTFLDPGLMLWIGLAALAFAVFRIYKRGKTEKDDLTRQMKEVVEGAKRGLGILPPELKERVKTEMEAEQDTDTKETVAVLKARKK